MSLTPDILMLPSLRPNENAGALASESDQGARLEMGLAHAGQGEYDRAIADFTAAIRQEPTLAEAYFQRAEALRLTGEYARPAAYYAAVVRLEPGHARAILQRGLMHAL